MNESDNEEAPAHTESLVHRAPNDSGGMVRLAKPRPGERPVAVIGVGSDRVYLYFGSA